MTRLGARYTVAGYLDEVARRSLIVTTESGFSNLETFLSQLPRAWGISDFLALFEQRLLPFGWGYQADTQRSALGQRTKITVFLPSVVEILHTGNIDHPTWAEKALTAHAWSITVRKGKAKMDVIPTSLFISEHALRRIYERSGGCSYPDFPQLIAALFQETLEKIDTLIRETIFVKGDGGTYATAVPTTGGLAIINWSALRANYLATQLGTLITVAGRSFFLGRGSFHPADFWGLPTMDAYGDKIHLIPSTFMRTYYGDEEISDARRESCVLLDVLLGSVQSAGFSPLVLLDAVKDPSGRRFIPMEQGLEPQASRGLRADVIDSLHWLNASSDEDLLLAPYGRTAKTMAFVNGIDWDSREDDFTNGEVEGMIRDFKSTAPAKPMAKP